MVWKKSSCSFGFCPNYLDPPSPKYGQLIPLFLYSNVPKKFGRGVPLPPHPQIDPLYTVCEKRTKNLGRALPSPPHLDKRTATFFLELSLTQSVRYVGIDLLGQLKSKEDSWSKQEPTTTIK